MKKLSLSILLLAMTTCCLAQVELTLYGNENDSTLIKKKESLMEKGFNVSIKTASEQDAPKENEFINRWTEQKLPSFSLVDLEGNTLTQDDLKGKLVHINFWSITCRPCIEEFPELNQIKDKYGDNIIYLAIAPESEKLVRKVIKKHDLDYRLFADAQDLFENMGIEGYPKNVFVNKDGIIEKIIDGTHYKIGKKKGKPLMIPDNFKHYDEVLAEMTSIQ